MALIYDMFCTICLVISLYTRYDLWLLWSKSVGRFTEFDTLITTNLWRSLALEIVVSVIAPYPFFDGLMYEEYVEAYDIYIEYEINDLLLFAMFLRIYLGFRFIFYLSEFLNPRTQRVCSINGCESDTFFALKGLMQQIPYTFLLGCLLISILIFGYHLRLFETPLNEISGQDFSSIWNSIWNMIITLTSTGYGDIYPKSFYGRLVGVAICFWGFIITSLLVVTVTNMLNFS